MTISNFITTGRVILVFLLVITFYLPTTKSAVLAVSLFTLAAFTDWLDGYLARYLNQTSHFGAFFDPVADKLMVISTLILLHTENDFSFLTLPILIIVCREIAVLALREWMARVNQTHLLQVSELGKFKTFSQIFSIISLLLYRVLKKSFYIRLGYVSLYIAVFLTVLSLFHYSQKVYFILKSKV